MESIAAARERARRKVGVADHILTQTYPLVKDSKLLLAVLQNVYEAVDAGILAILMHEHEKRRVPTMGETFEGRLALFQRHIMPKQPMPKEFLRFVGEVRETIHDHKQSPMEFTRKNQFVICSDSYRLRTLSESRLKQYVQQTRIFVRTVDEWVTRDDAVIAGRS